MNIEEIATKTEDSASLIVEKPVLPSSVGKRIPIMIYIGQEGRLSCPGYIVENTHPMRLIHDLKISGLTISHVADLLPIEPNTYKIQTCFVLVKEKPDESVSFAGEFKKIPGGYTGTMFLRFKGNETCNFWEIAYDE